MVRLAGVRRCPALSAPSARAATALRLVGSGRRETAPGKAGAAFAASTLGNVAGGLATALVVMQHLELAHLGTEGVGLGRLGAALLRRQTL